MERWEEEVWKRVRQGKAAPQRQDLRALELAEGENLGVYRHLVPQLGGRVRQTVEGLLACSRENMTILRGLGVLAGAGRGREKPQPVGKEPAEVLLKGCYYRTRKMLLEYTARSGEGETGCVFQVLARRAEQACCQIALALGQLG